MKKKKTTKKTTNKVDEADFLKALNNISRKLAYKFKFGYHDTDDMKQQITVFALEGLKNYDNKRPLENFLWTHVRNRLFNYKRDNYQRPSKPCLSCPLYDPGLKKSDSGCTQYANKNDCDLYSSWLKRNSTKKNLMHFTHLENKENNNNDNLFISKNDSSIETYIDKEFLLSIENLLTNEYREIYLKIKNGAKVPKSDISKLRNHIESLLKERNKNE